MILIQFSNPCFSARSQMFSSALSRPIRMIVHCWHQRPTRRMRINLAFELAYLEGLKNKSDALLPPVVRNQGGARKMLAIQTMP